MAGAEELSDPVARLCLRRSKQLVRCHDEPAVGDRDVSVDAINGFIEIGDKESCDCCGRQRSVVIIDECCCCCCWDQEGE